MRRVLFLTHYFAPEVGAPQVRLAAFAAHLAAAGTQVTVHAPPPHYPDGIVRSGFRNRALARARLADGTRIVRSAVYATPNRAVVRRLVNHASFAASAVATSWATGPQSAVVVESPPLFTAAAGVVYSRLKRAPLILNVADRWPASAIELGMLRDPRAIALAEALERWCYRHAAAIVVPTERMRAAIDAVTAAAGKVVTIAPAVDLERFDPTPKPGEGPLRVLYAGTLGLAHGLETLLAAAQRAGPDVVQVTIVGDGAAVAALRDARVANVRVLPPVSADEIPALYAASDAGVVLLRDLPIFREALPTKMLEVMAAGRAVVAALPGSAARLVEDAGAGVAVAPQDACALAEAFSRLAGDRDRTARAGASARACAEQHFGRGVAVGRWDRLLDEKIGTASRAARRG